MSEPTPNRPAASRAARTALSAAVLALSIALFVRYARNWPVMRDAVRHVARTVLSLPVP